MTQYYKKYYGLFRGQNDLRMESFPMGGVKNASNIYYVSCVTITKEHLFESILGVSGRRMKAILHLLKSRLKRDRFADQSPYDYRRISLQKLQIDKDLELDYHKNELVFATKFGYKVAPVGERYRGRVRTLGAGDHLDDKTLSKKEYEECTSLILKEIELSDLEDPSEQGFSELCQIYNDLVCHRVPCEMIVFNSEPIEEAYGSALQFMGIDVLYGLDEDSLLKDEAIFTQDITVSRNEYGLLDDIKDAKLLLAELDARELIHQNYWVYRVETGGEKRYSI